MPPGCLLGLLKIQTQTQKRLQIHIDKDTDKDIYIERIYTYMLHKEKYINYTENGESRPPMKNKDLTGKYHAKVTFS